MLLTEFIATTRDLIRNQVFSGRSNKLEQSLGFLCDALEENKMISQALSVQVTAGSHAELGDQVHSTQGNLTPTEAWTFLYRGMGNLGNSVYKAMYRKRLETEFEDEVDSNSPEISYSNEVKQMWRTVFADQQGVVEDSPFSRLDEFIVDLPGVDKKIEDDSEHDRKLISPGVSANISIYQLRPLDYNFLLVVGGSICAVACVFSLGVAALAVTSLIELTAAQTATYAAAGVVFGAASMLFFRTAGNSNPDANMEAASSHIVLK